MGSTWMVSGWGTTEYGADLDMGQDGALPKYLQYAYAKPVDAKQCEADLGRAGGLVFRSSVFDPDTAMW